MFQLYLKDFFCNPADVLSGVCDELQGWTVTLSGGCWWIGHDLSNYTEALVKCASKGAFLAQLPSNNDKWPEQLKKLFTSEFICFWHDNIYNIANG